MDIMSVPRVCPLPDRLGDDAERKVVWQRGQLRVVHCDLRSVRSTIKSEYEEKDTTSKDTTERATIINQPSWEAEMQGSIAS